MLQYREEGGFIDSQGAVERTSSSCPAAGDSFDNTPGRDTARRRTRPEREGWLPASQGRSEVHLRSSNPLDMLLIDPNYLGDVKDLARPRQGLAGHLYRLQGGLTDSAHFSSAFKRFGMRPRTTARKARKQPTERAHSRRLPQSPSLAPARGPPPGARPLPDRSGVPDLIEMSMIAFLFQESSPAHAQPKKTTQPLQPHQ